MSNLETAERIILGRTATAAAKELHDQGLLMPDLPENAVTSVNGSKVWRENDTLWVYAKPGEIGMPVTPDIQATYTPATARQQAYILLAAANHAETEKLGEQST